MRYHPESRIGDEDLVPIRYGTPGQIRYALDVRDRYVEGINQGIGFMLCDTCDGECSYRIAHGMNVPLDVALEAADLLRQHLRGDWAERAAEWLDRYKDRPSPSGFHTAVETIDSVDDQRRQNSLYVGVLDDDDAITEKSQPR